MNDIKVEDNNLELFNNWGKTDPRITKQVNKGGGRTITAIDAYQQILIMSEKFGPIGKWGFKNTTTSIDAQSGMALFTATFFYPDGSFEIINSIDTWIRPRNGEPRRDPDWAKKLMTDCLTKAFSYLLMNADIFLGRFDDNRYVEELKREISQQNAPTAPPRPPQNKTDAGILSAFIEDLRAAKTLAILKQTWSAGAGMLDGPSLKEAEIVKDEMKGKLK